MGSLDRSMAARLTGPYGSRYKFEPQLQPNPGDREAVVRLDVAGVCHGDVYSRDGGGPAPEHPVRPLTGGHEGVGVIIDIGIDGMEKPYGFRKGDVVGIAWRHSTCGKCEACLRGSENYCPHQLVNGMHRDGTFQRFIKFPVHQLIRIPHGFDKEAACPILCAGVTPYTALRGMNTRAGDWCAVVGAAGALGHLAVQYAKKVFKLKVVGIDGGSPEKEKFCRSLGCDEYVDFLDHGEELADEVLRRTSGGVHYALMLSPHQEAYDAAGQYMRFRGHVMAIGIGNCHSHNGISLRCVLITGATSGIGSALTGKIIDNGAFVIAVGRRQERLDELLSKYGSEKVAIQRFDVGEVSKLEAWVAELVETFPRTDAIILNAGTQYHSILLDPKSVSLDAITSESQINYLSPVHTSLLFLPHLQVLSQKQPVAIIFVTSGLSIVPNLMSPTYSATKSAVHSFTWTLRATLAADYPAMKIVELIPPAVQTELHTRQGIPKFGMMLDDFADEAWDGLRSGGEEIPVGLARPRTELIEAERRKAFVEDCRRNPAARLS
ncbi:Fc.00g081420.m01.CDS01 [Cosmosporella sp. VM-42]